MDVVPAVNLDVWEAQPFSGDVKDGFIYGRGTIDVKNSLMVRFLLTDDQFQISPLFLNKTQADKTYTMKNNVKLTQFLYF